MKNGILRPFLTGFVIIAVSWITGCNLKSINDTVADKPLKLESGELDRQEELALRAHHEFIMTMDPALGYVPTERLIAGEKKANEIMSVLGINSPTGINSLTWTERGPVNIGGRTRAILFDQNDATGNTVIAGGVGGGLWRTTNFVTGSPVTWTQIASVSANLAITCIAQDPQTLNTMYAGTGEGVGNADGIRGLGVYKSTNAGLTWSLLSSTTTGGTNVNDFSYVQNILVNNNGTHDIYAACRSAAFCNAGGLMRSSDGGSTWTRVLGIYTGCGNCTCATDFRVYDIEKSSGGDLWVASLTEATGAGKIWKSPAGATVGNSGTWVDKTPTGTFQRIELACSPLNNNRVYALCQGASSAVGAIFRTDDGAATPATSWTTVTNTNNWCDNGSSTSTDFSRGQAWYDLTLAIKPNDDNTVFAGGVDIMKTTDAGATWAQATQWAGGCGALPGVHADIHAIKYLPGSSTSFVVGCDGGLYYTNDGGTTFSTKNNSYDVTQYYSCAMNPASGSNSMLAGAQDNGSHKFSTAGLNTVTTASGGDGGFCFIDQKNPLQQITNFTGTSLILSNNTGTSFTSTGSFATDRFINPADFDTASSTSPGLATSAFYYCGGAVQNFRRVTINFSTLSVSSSSFAAGTATVNHAVSAVKVDPNTPNRVWVAMSTGDHAGTSVVPQLYIANSTNTTPVFTAVTLPAAITAGQYISSIDVENGNASHILITLSNYGVASVYESTDLGVNWTSLDNNGVNLPDVPVRWGMFIPSGYGQSPTSIGGIMLATELGVWGVAATSGTTTAWAQNATNMGNVRVDMLKLRGSDKMVAAATHGRGLFTAPLINLLPVTYLSFKADAMNNFNHLAWSVSNSIDNAGFEIERKYNGDNQFVKVGYVAAGNSSASNQNYFYDDNSIDLSKQVTIYRLKQLDVNGAFKYSDQVAVKRNLSGKFVLYSTADKNNVFVRTGTKAGINSMQVAIFSTDGKVLISQNEKYQDASISISGLANGVYFLRITAKETGETFVQKFIK